MHDKLRFQVACRFLRLSGRLDPLPRPYPRESAIDFLVRAGLAADVAAAAEMLLAGLDEETRQGFEAALELVRSNTTPSTTYHSGPAGQDRQ